VPERAFHLARLIAREDAGGGLVTLTIAPSDPVRATYERPGQYVSARAGELEVVGAPAGYFVLAGDVGAPAWQLILRPGGTSADPLLALRAGAHLVTTEALGGGFPCDEARGRPLLVAATGSGIAAVRPVVARRLGDGDAESTDVLLGVRVRADIPLAGEMDRWRRAGVAVIVCLSREDVPAGGDGFASGYVQDVARRRARPAASGAMIFAAGVKGMVEGIRRLASEIGVSETDVRTNY
jgi:sulfhydrogenase subunit gamma (sulfur reductase)